MTVAIKESLNKMYQNLQALEKTAAQAEDNAKKNVERAAQKAEKNANSSAKKSPPDLFSVPGGQQSDVDAKALASRLDGAIAKVEKLLKEEA